MLLSLNTEIKISGIGKRSKFLHTYKMNAYQWNAIFLGGVFVMLSCFCSCLWNAGNTGVYHKKAAAECIKTRFLRIAIKTGSATTGL